MNNDEGYEKENIDDSNVEGSTSVGRSTRRKIEIRTFSQTCFFCEVNGDAENLHICQTLKLSEKVKSMAIELGDSKIVAKLSQGDMVATEAKYHKSCLNKLFNGYRSIKNSSEHSGDEEFIEGISISYFSLSFLCCLTIPKS